jgi:hypothetical protein
MPLYKLHMTARQGGVHFAEGSYDAIAIKLFNELDMDCFYVRLVGQNPLLHWLNELIA